MPIELARNSRRSMPSRRACSSAFSSTRRCVSRSSFEAGCQYSVLERLPSQIGGRSGTSGAAFRWSFTQGNFDFAIA